MPSTGAILHNRRIAFFYLRDSALFPDVKATNLFDRTHQSMIVTTTMKHFIFALCAVFGCGCLNAQTNAWQPSPGHTQIPIWPGAVPDTQPVAGPEMVAAVTNKLVAGKPWLWVGNVLRPTITVYSPKGTNTGVAVVVFPGGGYYGLAIDLEGTEICDWLTSKGITGVLLKYRVPGSGPHWDPQLKRHLEPKAPTALEDAQRTMGLVRFHSAEWHIDAHKVGVLGFSAGGHLIANISTHFDRRLYPVVDTADKESCRPDFGVALYPGHMTENTTNEFELNPTLPVSSNMPPQFVLQAEDDHVDGVEQSLVYYIALKKAGVPVEMHLYAQGGHAFGLRRTKSPITAWPQLVEAWLRTIGMIPD
jgi:acetyl esterase/lipase